MKRLWQKYAEKIDAFSMRERVLVFFGAAFAVMMTLNYLVLRPLQAQQRNTTQELARQQSETNSLRQQAQKLIISRREDPDVAARRALAQLKEQVAQLDRQIEQKQSQFVPPDKIARLMEDMLARAPRLDLLDMRTFAAEPISARETDKAKPPPQAGRPQQAAKPERSIFRHGVELSVRGSYLDLLGYVSSLERLPLQMYWSKLDLQSEDYPRVVLKLTVYTLSFDKAWLVV